MGSQSVADRPRGAALGSASLRRRRRARLAPFNESPVQDHLHRVLACECPLHVLVQLRLRSRDDQQVTRCGLGLRQHSYLPFRDARFGRRISSVRPSPRRRRHGADSHFQKTGKRDPRFAAAGRTRAHAQLEALLAIEAQRDAAEREVQGPEECRSIVAHSRGASWNRAGRTPAWARAAMVGQGHQVLRGVSVASVIVRPAVLPASPTGADNRVEPTRGRNHNTLEALPQEQSCRPDSRVTREPFYDRAVKPEVWGAFGRESRLNAVKLSPGSGDHVGGEAGGVRPGRVGMRARLSRYPTNRYPWPCTVRMYTGCSGSGSNFCLSRRMWASTVRVVGNRSYPHTSSRSRSRVMTSDRCSMR